MSGRSMWRLNVIKNILISSFNNYSTISNIFDIRLGLVFVYSKKHVDSIMFIILVYMVFKSTYIYS